VIRLRLELVCDLDPAHRVIFDETVFAPRDAVVRAAVAQLHAWPPPDWMVLSLQELGPTPLVICPTCRAQVPDPVAAYRALPALVDPAGARAPSA